MWQIVAQKHKANNKKMGTTSFVTSMSWVIT